MPKAYQPEHIISRIVDTSRKNHMKLGGIFMNMFPDENKLVVGVQAAVNIINRHMVTNIKMDRFENDRNLIDLTITITCMDFGRGEYQKTVFVNDLTKKASKTLESFVNYYMI